MIVSEPVHKKSKNVIKTYNNEISLVIAAVFSNKLFLSSFQERRKVKKNKNKKPFSPEKTWRGCKSCQITKPGGCNKRGGWDFLEKTST